jgi:hypothetical protein
MGEAGADRERRLGIEAVGLVDLRNVRVGRREGRDHHVGVDAEEIASGDTAVGSGAEQRVVLEQI